MADEEFGDIAGRRNPLEPSTDLSMIPIIRSSAQVEAEEAGDLHGAASPTPDTVSPEATSPAVVGNSEETVVRSSADLDAPEPTQDTPLTEPPASEPVPMSVLAPSEPETLGQPVLPAARRKGRMRFPGGTAFRKIMHSEPLPTQSMPWVNRIAGSPYNNPYLQAHREADEDARRTLDFALRLGETMFRFGAGALEVETSIIVVAQAFGIRETEIDITNQSMNLNYAPDGQVPYSVQRVVRSWTQNYAGLALLHRLVSDIATGKVGRGEAMDRLAEIRRRPKPFPRWMSTLAAGLFAGTFVLYIGGGPVGAGVALLSTLLVMAVVDLMGRARVPEFFSTMAGGFMATVVALVLYALHVPLAPSMVVAGGLMMLLPSARFVSAVQDAINGFPVTAAGRFVSAFLSYVAIISGIVAAVAVAELLGVRSIDLAEESSANYPLLMMAILVFLAALFDAVVEQSEWRLLLPTALVSVCGYMVYVGVGALGLSPRVTPAIAAVVIGALGRYVALRMGAPQLVLAVPGILFLLPGLMIFRSMYEIAMDSGAVAEGAVGMFNASMVIMAIAAGVVLGDTLARPFTRSYRANERRRIGRR